MSGSGACVFAEFDTEAQAASVLARRPDGMEGFVAKGLARHPIVGLLERARQDG
jgi:4-diphosphocytidyl-2-C-methyl-D-erythritol kinase